MQPKATAMDAVPQPANLFGYSPSPQSYDELVDASGQWRPAWGRFVTHVNKMGAAELQRRVEEAELQLENDGVTFNPYDLAEDTSRPWLLDPIPLLLQESDWQVLAEKLEQRAILLDLILRDLFGPQRLLKERLLPPDFLFGHPAFQPSYLKLADPNQRQLQLYAADLARNVSGDWCVVGDRTRAPFGLGYVLENRVITSRMLPESFRECRTMRLSGFYMALKECLVQMAPDGKDNPHIVLWTHGPQSRSYFEDAYLARYLGFTLVQGDDLAVRQDRIMLKTLGGLVPVDVIFRRQDDELCDPVELDSQSVCGVSNLLNVMRRGRVAVANGLGSRLVESPMLHPFLPRICEFLLGETLKLPTAESWWCGQPDAYQQVLGEWESLVFRKAFRVGDHPPIIPATLKPKDKESFFSKLQRHPERYVAQRRIGRSTTPIWNQDKVVSWPLALRSFLVSEGEGYSVLSGGLARVAENSAVLENSPTSGEKSQDVWISSQEVQSWHSLLPSRQSRIELKRGGSELPSRVADALFWLGRNAERAEFSLRLIRLSVELMENERADLLEQSQILRALASLGQIPPDLVVPGIKETLPRIEDSLPRSLWSEELPMGFRASLTQVKRLGSCVRDRISLDAWRVLRSLDQLSEREARLPIHSLPRTLSVVDQLITLLLAFSGLGAESSTRTLGWRFLDLGRRLERGWQTSQFLRIMLQSTSEQDAASLDVALEVLDSLMTYRSRYLATLHPVAVCDLLVTDDTNPRSIAYQLQSIATHVNQLPRDHSQVGMDAVQRMAVSLQHRVLMADPAELMAPDAHGQRSQLQELLTRIEKQLPKLSDLVSSRFLVHAGLQRHFAAAEKPE